MRTSVADDQNIDQRNKSEASCWAVCGQLKRRDPKASGRMSSETDPRWLPQKLIRLFFRSEVMDRIKGVSDEWINEWRRGISACIRVCPGDP